jgi:hypothetical protein
MGRNQSKNTPLECMDRNFKKGFNRDYGVKLMPKKLKVLCEVDWPALGVGWPLEGSLDKTVVNEVYRVVVGRLEQFPYIDCWQDTVLSWSTWLRQLPNVGRKQRSLYWLRNRRKYPALCAI